MVVGVAGWPWVCASSGTSRRSLAIVATCSTRAVALGSQTWATAPWTITAYERLLMSSLVQQKWISSASPASLSAGAISASRFLRKYSTALTSWAVTRSVAAISSISAWPKSSTIARRRVTSSSVRERTPGTTCCWIRWMSHSISTWIRARLRAGSERWSTSGAMAVR